MARIKGWKRVSNTRNFVSYVTTGKRDFSQLNNGVVNVKKVTFKRETIWIATVNSNRRGFQSFVQDLTFRDKRSALRFVTVYMEEHPRG